MDSSPRFGRIGKAKVNLRGKREGKQFVGHVGPKSANVRFRAKPKVDAMVLTLIEAGKKPQTVTLRRVRNGQVGRGDSTESVGLPMIRQ